MVGGQSNRTVVAVLGESDPPRATALNFLRLLWELQHGLLAMSRRMKRQIGVTGPQRLVLRLLGTRPGMTARDLAQALHLDKSTLTGVVRRLERGGFLRRAVDPLDRRRQLLALTRKARAVAGALPGTVEWRVADALAGLSPEEIRAAERTLSLVAQTLERPARPARTKQEERRTR